MLEMASEPSDNIVLMIGICFLNDRNLLFSGVAAEVGVLKRSFEQIEKRKRNGGFERSASIAGESERAAAKDSYL